ncbi:MAG: NAD-dependent epimerase/dehydratase family protein [Candidatus Falkowbacteria bacterium]
MEKTITKYKILILGGGGYIGSNLSLSLKNAGHNVFAMARPGFIPRQNYEDSMLLYNDFKDTTSLGRILKDRQIDIVIHLISSLIPGSDTTSYVESIAADILPTIKLLDIMPAAGVNKIIFFSTGGAIYGHNGKTYNSELDPTNPLNYYGLQKLIIEKNILMSHRRHGLEYLILRPSNVYGKKVITGGNQGLIGVILGKIVRKEDVEVWGNGDIVRDYLYIDDCCRAVNDLIESGKWNEIVNVGSGIGATVNDIIGLVKEISGVNFRVNYSTGRKEDVPTNILNTDKLKGMIAWNNLIFPRRGIELSWNYAKRHEL